MRNVHNPPYRLAITDHILQSKAPSETAPRAISTTEISSIYDSNKEIYLHFGENPIAHKTFLAGLPPELLEKKK